MNKTDLLDRFEAWVERTPLDGCWIWIGTLWPNGYGYCRTESRRNSPRELAHRLSWRLHVGEIPVGMNVCHRCDVRSCVNPAHLFLGTQLDNVRDMDAKGRRVNAAPKGERHANSKLREADVLAIAKDVTTPRSVLAGRYMIDEETVSRIRARKAWTHLERPVTAAKRGLRGGGHPKTSITDAIALQIIERGRSEAKLLSEKHGLSINAVRKIQSGQTWRHLPRPSVKAT